jgi:hypothetical protein
LPAEWHLPRLAGGRFDVIEPDAPSVRWLAEHLRQADQEEIHATVGHRRFGEVLAHGTAISDSTALAVDRDGTPVALFGVSTVSLLSNIGCPWMVATDAARLFRCALVALGRSYTAAMLEHYDRLENAVDARNETSVAWLQHLGYQMGEPKPYGALALPFRNFWIERN